MKTKQMTINVETDVYQSLLAYAGGTAELNATANTILRRGLLRTAAVQKHNEVLRERRLAEKAAAEKAEKKAKRSAK